MESGQSETRYWYPRLRKSSVIEDAQDRPEDRVRHENRQRRAYTIVKPHESRRLEHAGRSWAVRFAGHARMNPRQRLPADHADEQGMAEPNQSSSIPVRAAQHVHSNHIKEGEGPAH